jgi:hypothetical protein
VRRPCIVLTLGSPPEKGGKKKQKTLVPIWLLGLGQTEEKKNPGSDPAFRTLTFRTWTDEKKNPGINPGQPAGKGREKKNP